MYYKRNIEARSRSHCCLGKAVLHILSVCLCSLSYPARRACAPYYIIICGQFGCTTFFQDFRKEILNFKCLFLFYLQLLSETFLIL